MLILEINTCLGYFFFSWCENMTCNNAIMHTCMQYRANNFVFCNLWSMISWVCNVETDFKLR